MGTTEYFDHRTAERGITMKHVNAALSNEIRREVQSDGRTRIWGWVEDLNQCIRVIVDSDRRTLVNAFPDRKCTKQHT